MNNYKSFDFETTGLKPHLGSRAFAFSIGDPDGTSEVYQMNKRGLRILKDFWADPSIEKVGHNIKFDLSFLPYHNIKIAPKTVIHDTMIQSQLLRNLAPNHSLDGLCWELVGYSRELDKEVKLMGKQLGGYDKIPKSIMKRYQEADAQRAVLLHETFFPDIKENDLLYKDYLNEMDLIWVTLRMEKFGITVHKKNCNNLIGWLQDELDSINDQVFEELGYRANLGSGPQVQKILFKKYDFQPLKFGKEGPSVDMDTINHLRENKNHPILDLILKFRTYTKGVAMVSSYLEMSTNAGKLHPNINTNGAKRTGRESSSDPNLQNVSKATNPRNPFTVPARSAFTAGFKRVLFLVDYSGIEMRLIVDACGQKELRKIINRGGDVHEPSAICFYGKRYAEEKDISKKKVLRSASKNAHFALAYGASVVKLASTLSLTIEETKEGLERYASKYPEVAYFTRNIIQEVRSKGYVTTSFGRKLYVMKNKPYSGANYKIQGYASGVIKRAQVKVDTWLKQNYPDIRLVIPIHDELIISYPTYLLKKKNEILKKISLLMITIPGVSVRLDVEWKKTLTTWDKAKEINVDY